jgi:hypothetical protein
MSEPPVVRPNSHEPPVVVPSSQRGPAKAGSPSTLPVATRSDSQRIGASPGSGTGHWADLLHKRWAVLAMLFGATAALGLPFLWRSRGFTRNEKWFWSAVVSLYTILIFWLFAKVMWWSYTNIRDALA